jgi:chitin synthase
VYRMQAEIEGGLDLRGAADPYIPYQDPENEQDPQTPYMGGQGDTFNQSSQAPPLVANALPFQRADTYNEYDERSRSVARSSIRRRLTDARDDTMSLGTESYIPCVTCSRMWTRRHSSRRKHSRRHLRVSDGLHCWLLT